MNDAKKRHNEQAVTTPPHITPLARIRQDRGMSQPQLAVAANVGISSVQRLEARDPRVGFGVAAKVAAALDVPVESFYDGEDLPAHLKVTGSGAPAWAVAHHEEIMRTLREISAAVRVV